GTRNKDKSEPCMAGELFCFRQAGGVSPLAGTIRGLTPPARPFANTSAIEHENAAQICDRGFGGIKIGNSAESCAAFISSRSLRDTDLKVMCSLKTPMCDPLGSRAARSVSSS